MDLPHLSMHCERVLSAAAEESGAADHHFVGVEHLFLGLVREATTLVTEAWGEEYGDAIDSLKLYVHYLRQKLEIDPDRPEYIMTLRGVGYRFVNR